MDFTYHTNPLETVQLISVYTYITLLSDFLFIESYLSENDQNKQIPIVNALYEYLHEHNDNLEMKAKLVRALLQGSDLYGERNNENFDEIFVNSMFDYIISSLVFDKYGNIYGFIVDVAYKTETIEINSFCMNMKNTLKTAEFKNKYGNSSKLTNLAVDRIFTDLLLPFFPQPKTNIFINLFSFDFIYAQAASIFFRYGRINTNYYSNITNQQLLHIDPENLFEEYVLAGYTLENLLLTKDFDFSIAHAFALPALCFYVFSEKKLLRNTRTTLITSDPLHLQLAYESLFYYLNTTFEEINSELNKDSNFQLQEACLNFRPRRIIAKTFINLMCYYLDQSDKETSIGDYMNNPENYHCEGGQILPNLNEWFSEEINSLAKKYYIYESESIKKAFGNAKINLKLDNQVSINLLEESRKASYNLLEFTFSKKNTVEYYALVRENSAFKLIKESDNPQLLQQMIGSTVKELKKNTTIYVFKRIDETFTEFVSLLAFYKTNRLQEYLKHLNNNEIRNNWWQEFGAFLGPYYPCLTDDAEVGYDNAKSFCNINTAKFLNTNKNLNDVLSKITNDDTKNLMSLEGTSVKTLFLKEIYHKAISDLATKPVDNLFNLHKNLTYLTYTNLILNGMTFAIELTFLTYKHTDTLRHIFHEVTDNFNFNFTSVIRMMFNMDRLLLNLDKKIENPKNELDHSLYVKTQSLDDSTGYGYRFIYLTSTKDAQLRSNFEVKKQILVSLGGESSSFDDFEKVYNSFDKENLTIVPYEKYYEINNQLRMNITRYMFAGIPTPHYYYIDCDIDQFSSRPIFINTCPRIKRLKDKTFYENEAIKLVLSKTNLTKEEVQLKIRKYVFPNENRIDLQFVQNWVDDKSLKEPMWASSYLIENQTQLSELRYNLRLENSELAIDDARYIIRQIYSFREEYEITKGTTFTKIVEEYNRRKAYFSATFEDYYALHNFATSGYTRIAGDTNESNRMKIALYRLAIRQSDDPHEEFDLTLYKVEHKPQKLIDELFFSGKKTFKLQKFTIASTNELSAWKFATIDAPNFLTILYEMKFFGPYIRAKIEQFSSVHEKKSVLLPGSEFHVRKAREVHIAGIGDVLKVELVHKHSNNEKYMWYRNIVKKLEELSSKQ